MFYNLDIFTFWPDRYEALEGGGPSIPYPFKYFENIL